MTEKRTWPTKGEIVEVEWLDSASTRGWTDLTAYTDSGLVTCRSVGYLLSKSKESIRVLQSQSNHGGTSEMLAIPRVCVQSIRTVGKSRAK